MSRLNQTIRNSFIRVEGLIYQLFGIFGKLFDRLNQFRKFFGRLFGFDESKYFLGDEAQAAKSTTAEKDVPVSIPQSSSPAASSSTRRRPDANMERFLKMAEPKKASK